MKTLCHVDSCKADLFCTWYGVWVRKETSFILAQHSLINSNIWDPYSLWHIAVQLKITVQVDIVMNTVYCWDCETVNTSLFSVTYRLPFIRTHVCRLCKQWLRVFFSVTSSLNDAFHPSHLRVSSIFEWIKKKLLFIDPIFSANWLLCLVNRMEKMRNAWYLSNGTFSQ